MNRPRPIASQALLAVVLSAAVTAVAQQPTDLRVTRVALFSSGVGYFECEATVRDTATAQLSFRTEQINDIIKSLIVQDFGGGTVGVVSYASQDPIEKRLRSFGVDLTGKPTLAALLDQLRGEPVEISGERAARGVIVGVEKQKIPAGQTAIEVDVLNVLTEGGVQQLRFDQLGGLRLVNPKIDAELRKALETLATAHDADKKTVVLRFDGQGERRVQVAYLLEAPIWKTTYRLAIDAEGIPFLQGWATVENATEEDWRDVRLSLVSGRPISFVMDLYTPIYIPRPKEELELYASLRPPTYEGASEERRGERAAGREMAAKAMSPPPIGGEGGRRMADAAEQLGIAGEPLQLEGRGVASVAAAQEAGELFAYTIKTPVSIPRQHSAMLPIVNQAIEGKKVSIYNPATHAKYPLNGLELVNKTDLHLMQGPVTLFDGNVYAGDAKLPDLRAGEKRLIAYALDLGREVTVESRPRADEIVSLRIVKGVLIRRHKYVDERTYTVKNKDPKERTVLIEQPYGDEWKLIEPKEPYERTASLSRFKLDVKASGSASLKVVLEQVTDQQVVLSNLPFDQIQIYVRSRVISPAVKQALEKVVELRTKLDRIARDRQQRESDLNAAVQEQARVRENLKTLQAGSDAHKRQLTKFDEIETRIEKLNAELDGLRKAEESARRELEDYLASLNVE